LKICGDCKDWEGVAKYGRQMLAVNPLLPEPHRYLAGAAEELGLTDEAMDAYRALLRMDPVDPARVHFRLASLLEQRGELALARRHVLQSLEEAPRFRAALALLLKLHAAATEPGESGDSPPASEPGQESPSDQPLENGQMKDGHRESREARP